MWTPDSVSGASQYYTRGERPDSPLITPMRILTGLLLAVISIVIARAETPEQTIVTHINQSGTVTVEAPQELLPRLECDKNRQVSEKDAGTRASNSVGYRVEIFADNNARTARGNAQSRRDGVMSRLPQYPAYMVFESPYWRVRVGDFATRAEAEAAMADIRRAFPSFSPDLRIVRSRIK